MLSHRVPGIVRASYAQSCMYGISPKLGFVGQSVSHGEHNRLAGCQRALTIGLIPGDGVGKEVIPAARRVLEAVLALTPTFVDLNAGFEHFQRTGTALPHTTINSLRYECDGALFGAVSSPSHQVKGYSSPIVQLRKELELFANIRPVASPAKLDNGYKIDMLIVRENTECLYIKSERIVTDPDTGLRTAWADRKISEYACSRIAQVAFKQATLRAKQRTGIDDQPLAHQQSFHLYPKVTMVHKSNVLSVSDGLFRTSVKEVWSNTPAYKNAVHLDEQLVDSMVYRMFREPHIFDVVVAPNLYGDIISDAAAALVGSLGVVGSANVGDKFVIGEPVHGSAPDISGKGIANPIAAIRSAGLLLDYLGYSNESSKIYASVDRLLLSCHNLTPDLGGNGSTHKVTDAIIRDL
ncbi:hypothetical protein BASA50_008955 [Batrachochytrium salamandrivorans]|uniref:Isopropylmalate dehydrogenase-like domain-containing protein n=1 Tax=Batrachochytrium salamandrivorans TaxID=1357716 RepID=A0ABQ8F5I0_9FUNG|nr:hypothetical protein BASA62_007369 [Batrachochytrium salamandrivorans]KAH6590955.1 hypothetical protein BASA50_008955 [Batrachochytrium salamandrivorans]KAH9268555.1 hypothetical protein BASA84_000160 [Batrachochytrium salamandrivorans]KAH9277224.1 hypothetical protein BASA83_000086 [Batrachochytrium salamandrivorans]